MDGTSLIPPTEQKRSQNIPHRRSAILNNSSNNWMKLNRLEKWTLEDRSARQEKMTETMHASLISDSLMLLFGLLTKQLLLDTSRSDSRGLCNYCKNTWINLWLPF